MSDLISREELKREFETIFYNDSYDLLMTERLIDDAPTVEARPKGEWEYVGMGIYECTNCKAEYEAGIADHCNINNSEFKYCPNCGADMRGNV